MEPRSHDQLIHRQPHQDHLMSPRRDPPPPQTQGWTSLKHLIFFFRALENKLKRSGVCLNWSQPVAMCRPATRGSRLRLRVYTAARKKTQKPLQRWAKDTFARGLFTFLHFGRGTSFTVHKSWTGNIWGTFDPDASVTSR